MRLALLLYIGLGLVVTYEVLAAITNTAPTISELVRIGGARSPVVGYLGTFALGFLTCHLFFPWRVPKGQDDEDDFDWRA